MTNPIPDATCLICGLKTDNSNLNFDDRPIVYYINTYHMGCFNKNHFSTVEKMNGYMDEICRLQELCTQYWNEIQEARETTSGCMDTSGVCSNIETYIKEKDKTDKVRINLIPGEST